MSEAAAPWTLTIASDLRLLAAARSFVEAACLACGFDAEAAHAIVLAADEAVNNVIRHAHQGRPDAVVRIRCFPMADGIEIHLIDEGEPFDLAAVPHLDPGELRVGGRGVFLMRSLMDELTCEPRDRGGNTLRMVKRRPPSREAAAAGPRQP
jgi:serine/threonine-protein kinase RsbW